MVSDQPHHHSPPLYQHPLSSSSPSSSPASSSSSSGHYHPAPTMAVVNVNLNNMINAKDSRWLQLEVCREFQRSKCSRSDTECKFAHPPANVEVQNGRVIACYDSIKVRSILSLVIFSPFLFSNVYGVCVCVSFSVSLSLYLFVCFFFFFVFRSLRVPFRVRATNHAGSS